MSSLGIESNSLYVCKNLANKVDYNSEFPPHPTHRRTLFISPALVFEGIILLLVNLKAETLEIKPHKM